VRMHEYHEKFHGQVICKGFLVVWMWHATSPSNREVCWPGGVKKHFGYNHVMGCCSNKNCIYKHPGQFKSRTHSQEISFKYVVQEAII
jgi:hypothetical protein